MAKMVGYACNIKASWMKYARQLLLEGLSKDEYKEKLNDYLSFEIDSSVRLRKSREILMHVWFYEDEEIIPLRKKAIELIEKYPEYEQGIGLCLILIAYPVVADICKIMGKLLAFQDYFTNSVLKQKLYDEWGERGSLETTSRRVTLTLKDMELLKVYERIKYYPVKININVEDVASFLVYVAMKLDGGSYYTLSALSSFEILFPFRYSISKEWFVHDERFTMATFNGELTLSLSEIR